MAIAFVGATQAASFSNVQTVTRTLTAGNSLVVGIETNIATGNVPVSTISDTLGNTYVFVGQSMIVNSPADQYILFYLANSIIGGVGAVITYQHQSTSNSYVNLIVAEYSGGPLRVLDTGALGLSSGPGSLTTYQLPQPLHSNIGDLLVEMALTGGSPTVGTDFTQRGTDGFSSYGDRIPSAGPELVTFSGTGKIVFMGADFTPVFQLISADRSAQTSLGSLAGTQASGAYSPFGASIIDVSGSWGPAPSLTVGATLNVVLSGGTYSAGAFTLQFSNDGSNWYTASGNIPVNLTAAGLYTQSASINIANQGLPARFVRLLISTATTVGSGAPVIAIGLTIQ